jgi:hypothetical protein
MAIVSVVVIMILLVIVDMMIVIATLVFERAGGRYCFTRRLHDQE